MAQILGAEANWEGAATEWVSAMKQLPGYWLTAVAALAPVPERNRDAVMKVVGRETSLQSRLLRAALMGHWGDPEGGARGLIAALPPERPAAVEALTQFADVARAIPSAGATRARGMALEEIARRSTGLAASRARVEAARAYSDGGDREGARRMLGGVAEDTAAGVASVSAAATLIGVLVDDGKVEEAERRLTASRKGMPTDEYQVLNRRVATGWIRAGELDRAERTLQSDSTVEGIALAGRIAIYRGDLVGGVSRLRMAGPYAGTREEATDRTALLALLQPIETDTLVELGAALLSLERRDSAAAAGALERLAGKLPAAKGGAELRLLAGRVHRAQRRNGDAERLLRAAAVEEAPATAPAAELELARLMIGLQRNTEAITLLEHLILTYPTSALVPQARRALDEARGAIPRT
jgi:predicted negative regulator of RcsB-dependent stress response